MLRKNVTFTETKICRIASCISLYLNMGAKLTVNNMAKMKTIFR